MGNFLRKRETESSKPDVKKREEKTENSKPDVKVNVERFHHSFNSFETPDKKGYLIPCGNLNTADKKQLKLFKEGKQLHFVKTVEHEGEQFISDYRYDIPYDFDPISVTCNFNPFTSDIFLYLAKPPVHWTQIWNLR